MSTPIQRTRELVSKSGLTVEEFAAQALMDAGRLSAILSGERAPSSLDLAKVATAGRVTVEWLLGDDYRQGIADAIAHAECEKRPRCVNCMTDAVLAVRDEEIEKLRAQVPQCNGICVTADEIGVPVAGNPVAYPHPACPLHGDLEGFAMELSASLNSAQAENARIRSALYDLLAEWTHRATGLAAESGAAPDIECNRMLAGADELDRVRFALSALLNSKPASEGRDS